MSAKKNPERSVSELERLGLPANTDAERVLLGSLLFDNEKFDQVSAWVAREDFTTEQHGTLFRRMCDIRGRGEKVDIYTACEELMRFGELGLLPMSYVASLTDGLPILRNVESYAKIVRDKAILRQAIRRTQTWQDKLIRAEDSPEIMLGQFQVEMAEVALRATDDTRALNLRGVVERTPGGINTFLASQAHLFHMPSRYPALNEIINGFQPKKTYILAGDTSHGKTAFALNLAQSLAIDGHPGIYFTVEMGREEMLQRMVCAHAEVSLWKFTKGRCDGHERAALSAAANELADLPLYLDDTANLTASDLMVQARRAKQKHGIKWIIVDYLQILDYTSSLVKGGRPLTEYEGITAFSRAFKLLAKTLDVAIIILSQFSKDKERSTGKIRRPILHDLHGSGAIGKDADVVAFIWRPWLHTKAKPGLENHAELIIAKHRGGPLGFINLEFKGNFTRFYQSEDQTEKQIG